TAAVTVTIAPGGKMPSGCTDSTVPGGCADVTTRTRIARKPSCCSSATTTPAGWPTKAAEFTATPVTDGDTAVLGVAGLGDPDAWGSPARQPIRPTITKAAAASNAAAARHALRGRHATGHCHDADSPRGS